MVAIPVLDKPEMAVAAPGSPMRKVGVIVYGEPFFEIL